MYLRQKNHLVVSKRSPEITPRGAPNCRIFSNGFACTCATSWGLLRQIRDVGKLSQNYFARVFSRFPRAKTWLTCQVVSQNSSDPRPTRAYDRFPRRTRPSSRSDSIPPPVGANLTGESEIPNSLRRPPKLRKSCTANHFRDSGHAPARGLLYRGAPATVCANWQPQPGIGRDRQTIDSPHQTAIQTLNSHKSLE
jgi:hypothetical protein